jgi:hypothetical protein
MPLHIKDLLCNEPGIQRNHPSIRKPLGAEHRVRPLYAFRRISMMSWIPRTWSISYTSCFWASVSSAEIWRTTSSDGLTLLEIMHSLAISFHGGGVTHLLTKYDFLH